MARPAELIRSLLAEKLGGDDVLRLGEDEPLAVLGVDSVTLISLAAELQQRNGVGIDDEVVLDPEVSIASLAAAAGTRAVHVAGAGVVAPTGAGVRALWDGLLTGRANRIDMPYRTRRPHRAGVLPGATADEVTGPDRLIGLVVVAAEEALAEAGEVDRSHVHLVVGTTDTGGNALGHALTTGKPVPGSLAGTLAARAAAELGLGGGATTVGSASASGAVALGHARDLLASGDAAEVLVVGADTVSETAFQGLAALRTLFPDGCRPFSSERGGIALSEGAAALLLRRGRGAGSLAGYGASSLTTHPAAPEPAGIELAIRRALDDAGIEPRDVAFVNTHGPGTKLGDIAEMAALRAVFGADLPVLTSSKGVLWHLQGGAGVVESLACLLSLRHQTITPTTGGAPLDPEWSDVDIPLVARPLDDARWALSISCGLGGVNTALVWGR